MVQIDFGAALRQASRSRPSDMPAVLTMAAGALGASDVVVYLVDFGQTALEPLPDLATHAAVPEREAVTGSMAGRAYTEHAVVVAERGDSVRIWAPIIEGSDNTGVLALTVSQSSPEIERCCAELGLLAGYLIAAQSRNTDVYNLYRRRHAMSLAASMQWDLLPPLVLTTENVRVAGLVEPAYDVGGDCFDYAFNAAILDLAIMDAVGHGLGSAVIASLAMGTYRHSRREGRPLSTMHHDVGGALHDHLPDITFSTGLLARLDTDSGTLTWTNAGHPLPLLVRGGRVVKTLHAKPTPPWGILDLDPELGTEDLEPGDLLVFYTDGVIEGRTPDGDLFGADRLADIITRHASEQLAPEAIARNLVQSVRDHQQHELADDATLLLVQWDGPSPGSVA